MVKKKEDKKKKKDKDPIHIKKSEEGSLTKIMEKDFGKKAFNKKGDLKISDMNKLKKDASPEVKKKIVFAENARKWNKKGKKK